MKIVYVHILFSIVYSHSHYITISPWSGSIKKRINKQFTGFLLAVMQQEENLQPCTDHFSTIFYRFLFYVFFYKLSLLQFHDSRCRKHFAQTSQVGSDVRGSDKEYPFWSSGGGTEWGLLHQVQAPGAWNHSSLLPDGLIES